MGSHMSNRRGPTGRRAPKARFGAAGALILSLALSAGGAAEAASVVAPNADATTYGGFNADIFFGNMNSTGFSAQFAVPASDLAGIRIGALITGIGFRLVPGYPTIGQDLDYSSFDIQLGAFSGNVSSLNEVYSANESSGMTTVRSGALDIAGGSFQGGQTINPFYTINFSTPYQYEGGALLLMITDSAANSSTSSAFVPLDSNQASNSNVYMAEFPSATSTLGLTNFLNVPVLEFTYSAVPEPASWAMLICGAALAGAMIRRRREAALGFDQAGHPRSTASCA